jgi:hypothetical protein
MGAQLWVTASPAMAACSLDNTNQHTLGDVFQGWSRLFCQPANNFIFQAKTNHGHGDKYVGLWHDGTSHLHCDSFVSGSGNATCQDTVSSTAHHTYHDVAGSSNCNDSMGDGHGFNCHTMESLS